jgi:Methyltransferase domain
MPICKICNSETELRFTSTVLNKYEANYYQCKKCFFLYPESPFWLEEAYKSVINTDDTGILERNLYFLKKLRFILPCLFHKNSRYLDYGGGYGIFTRLMRDNGFDYYWQDIYCENLLARGFEAKAGDKFDALTAFEVFEHLVDPLDEISKMLTYSENIFFSTEIIPTNPLPGKTWWYYAFTHGQHISFYSIESLKAIAQRFGLNLYSNGKNFHLLSARKMSNIYYKTLLKLSQVPFINILTNTRSKTESDSKLLTQLRQKNTGHNFN